MSKNAILAVGLAPEFADFDQFPDLNPEIISAYIKQQIGRVRDAGFEVVECLISPDDAGERKLTDQLIAKRFACIVVGAGLREPPSLLFLFEKVINVIHVHAPEAKICFNSSPADTLEAVKRTVGG